MDINKIIDFSDKIFDLAEEDENITDIAELMACFGICVGSLIKTFPKDVQKQEFQNWVETLIKTISDE